MKRYLLFAFYDYYPSGGWSDFVDSFDSLEEAQLRLAKKLAGGCDCAQIVDITTGTVVDEE